MDWSTRLRNLRGNLKQSEFAERIGLDRSYISQLETGKRPILEDVQRRILQMEAELAKPHQSTAMLKEATPTRPPRRIPVVSYAQAGEGGNFDDLANQIEEWVTTDSRDPNVFAVIIEGQSMEPAFFPGDIVVVAPNSEPRTNDIVLAREAETGKVWLKKYRLTGPNGSVVQLISFNPDYEPIERPRAAFRFIYPVVERKLRR